jgi:hypothetical protein
VFAISKKKTTSNNQRKGPTGGAAKKDCQSSPRCIAAATSLVNLTVGCGETEGRNVDDVLPAIDEAINEMFPPLRETLADAMKEPPLLFQVDEGVAAARQSSGADMDMTMNLMR